MPFFVTARQAAEKQLDYLAAKAPGLVAAFLILLVGWLIARLVRGSVQRVLARTSTEGHVDFVVARMAFIGVIVVAAVTALSAVNVSLRALLTGLGLASVAVGFALKDVIGNMLAGIIILLQRPFTIGDAVKIDAAEGTVENVRIRDTQLRAADGTVIFVPNGTVYSAVIVNVSAAARRMAEVVVPVEMGADVAAAVGAAQAALEAAALVLAEPAPQVLIDTLGDGAVRLSCRFWVSAAGAPFATARSDVTGALKRAMDDAGVALK